MESVQEQFVWGGNISGKMSVKPIYVFGCKYRRPILLLSNIALRGIGLKAASTQRHCNDITRQNKVTTKIECCCFRGS